MKACTFSLVVILSLFSPTVFSQTGKIESFTFSDVAFGKFADTLETRTGYKFFYDPAALDSVVVNGTFEQMTISDILDQVFRDTDISFAIDAQQNIFVIRGFAIQKTLPDNYFNPEKTSNSVTRPFVFKEISEDIPVADPRKIYSVGAKANAVTTRNAIMTGYIREIKTGTPIPGASLYVSTLQKGVSANEFGQYTITLPAGTYKVDVNAMGMAHVSRTIVVYADGKLDFDLQEEVASLKEVVIESERNMNVNGRQMGFERLDIKTMKKVLAAMGEVDVFRVALTLPGVQSAGEGTTGLNVRGGATDQNLILFNDAVVFNPSHLFGFFSAFNPDIVKRVELLKSAVPASLGGRLASVIDISSQEGNRKSFSGSGGIGLLTTRLTVEGPLNKNTAVVLAGRSTYSNWLLKQIPDDDLKKSKASFYDLNFNVSHEGNDRNSLFVSAYVSSDDFKFRDDTVYRYANVAGSLRWKHLFSSRLHGVVNLSHSAYQYSMTGTSQPASAFVFQNRIHQSNLKADFSVLHFENHEVNFGIQTSYYMLSPGTINPENEASLVIKDILDREDAVESAIFVADNFEVNKRLSIYGGIRYSFYSAFGPGNIYQYTPGLTKNESSIADTIAFNKGDRLASYHGPEARISFKYVINDHLSLKGSYNRMRQYLQSLSNTTSISPTDVWKLSDMHIKPQIGDQLSLGVYKNFHSGLIETSVEGYYKTMTHGLDYKDGAEFILNHAIEADVVNVSGKAYGFEFMLKKNSGKLNGWLNYTFSRSFLRSNTEHPAEVINNGRYYPSNFDKPHAVNLVGNYKFSHRLSLSVNGVYSTGRPITLPIAKYNAGTTSNILYSSRNEYRVADYLRLDVSLNIEGNHKIKKLAHSSWTIGVYNLTGRKNVYSVYFRTEGADVRGYQMSIFGTPIPTITYNFKF